MSASLAAFTQEQMPPGADTAANDDADPLTAWVQDFEDAERASIQARELAEKCRDYYDGRQFTAAEIETLKKRRQPPIVNNKIKPKIQLLLGLERRGRSDPKAFPRTPTEDNKADVATQTLRYICDDQRYDVVRSSVFENMIVEGVGGCEVIAERAPVRQAIMQSSTLSPADAPDYNVVINHVRYERLFWDPHSRHSGFSDARYIGQVIWMDRDEALSLYPGADDVLDQTLNTSTDAYSETPSMWCDSRRRRVRVVQMHRKRGGEWFTGTFTRGGFVEGPTRSPYLDRHGKPTCPLIMRSAFCDRDGNRYSPVRDMIPLQDAINKRESKLLHSLNVNRVIMEQGAVANVDTARNEAAKPDGVLEISKGFEFRIEKDQSEIAGQFRLLEYAIGQMNANGPNASMSGKDPRDLSGRAIIAQQSGGVTEHEPIADELRQHTHKVMEAAWMRAKQFWTAAKTIRVTDDARDVAFVTLNRPVTLMDELKAMPPEQAQQAVQQLGLKGPDDPRLQAVIRIDHAMDDMDVDITVEEGPDVPTLQNEQWQAFTQLPESVLTQFPPEFFIQANPAIRDKDKLIAILEQHQNAQAADKQQAQQFAMQMQQAQLGKAQGETALTIARAKDVGAQSLERLHTMAADHASMMSTPQPIVPNGLGAAPGIDLSLSQPQPQALTEGYPQ